LQAAKCKLATLHTCLFVSVKLRSYCSKRQLRLACCDQCNSFSLAIEYWFRSWVRRVLVQQVFVELARYALRFAQ
jgi:hypothetical protein